MESGRATVDGDLLTLTPSGYQLMVKTAFYFEREVATGEDPLELIGRVQDAEQLERLGGEHISGSVLIGGNAYDVVEGLVCDPVIDPTAAPTRGHPPAPERRA
jgi:hypothetical protein